MDKENKQSLLVVLMFLFGMLIGMASSYMLGC